MSFPYILEHDGILCYGFLFFEYSSILDHMFHLLFILLDDFFFKKIILTYLCIFVCTLGFVNPIMYYQYIDFMVPPFPIARIGSSTS